MKLIEHFVGGKIIPGKSDKKGKVLTQQLVNKKKKLD